MVTNAKAAAASSSPHALIIIIGQSPRLERLWQHRVYSAQKGGRTIELKLGSKNNE
jgi:hypothetical protein